MNKAFSHFTHIPNDDYAFRDLNKVDSQTLEKLSKEGVVFGSFNSADDGWWLVGRDAPTPKENEVTASVPYMQGNYDFSILNGQRYFENRTLTYKLTLFDSDYHYRMAMEENLKRELMPIGKQRLYDTHAPGYYWEAKCISVQVEDDEEKGTATATVEFEAYPFAYTSHNEGDDIWDDVEFDHWIWQYVSFSVNGDQQVIINNIGSRPVESHFEVTGNIKVAGGFGSLDLNHDNSKNTTLILDTGKNTFNLSGNGSIKFMFRREEMI